MNNVNFASGSIIKNYVPMKKASNDETTNTNSKLNVLTEDSFTPSSSKTSNPIKEPSEKNADFFLVKNIGYTEWAQENEDGTYSVYGKYSYFGAEPELKRIIQA